MIPWCAVAGLLVGSCINWLADYLPRFAGNPPARKSTEADPRFAFAFIAFLVRSLSRKNRRGLPWRNLAIELLMACLFVFAWVRVGWSPNYLFLALADSFFVLIALIDLKYRLILNVLVFPAMLATLLIPFVVPGANVLAALVGGAFGGVIFWFAARVRPGELGSGDIKLATLIGLFFGFPHAIWALLIGVCAGGVAVIVLLFSQQANLQTRIPYAPFLCLGALVVLGFAPLLTFG